VLLRRSFTLIPALLAGSFLVIVGASAAKADNDWLVKEWENVVADTALMKLAPSTAW